MLKIITTTAFFICSLLLAQNISLTAVNTNPLYQEVDKSIGLFATFKP